MDTEKTFSILLTGVGGQGILLAARVIASAAEAAGFEVASNEIHGMAQRGGSVTAQVRFGAPGKTLSPLALEGTVDVLAALEPAEALRYAHFLRPGGFAAVALQRVIPVTVSTGAAVYPADVEDRLRTVFPRLVACDCAEAAGNPRLANTVLTGIVAGALPVIPPDDWRRALRWQVKPAFVDLNLNAFEIGNSIYEKFLQSGGGNPVA